ncbi:hypothetical protein JCM11672_00380 [Alkaliphilus crotonatoxidans]
MFYHVKELQYHAKPERPDPLFAKKLRKYLEVSLEKYLLLYNTYSRAGMSVETESTETY